MKNITITISLLFLIIGNVFAQQMGLSAVSNPLDNWTEFTPKQEKFDEPTQIITGNITEDTKLSKRDTYLLMGSVFVTNNATLTIEPGTVILGDYESKASLTISKGATIIAEGTETDPIVFSSNRQVKRPGDWGGVIVLGNAPLNKFGNATVAPYYSALPPANYAYTNFGGDEPNNSSGVLKYVRVEFSGARTKGPAGYFNGLLLAGVGNETVLENIMVSYAVGNGFEVVGGDVNLNKLVSYRTNSADFKFNNGAQVKFNNSLAVRSPYASKGSRSKCMKILSYDKKEETDFSKAGTNVVASNLTLVNESKDLATDIRNGLVKESIFVGANASLDLHESVISGFNPAVVLDNEIQINQESLDKIKFVDMFFNNCNGNIFVEDTANNDDLENWYGNSAFMNVYSKSSNEETFIEVENKRRLDYRLQIDKITATNKN